MRAFFPNQIVGYAKFESNQYDGRATINHEFLPKLRAVEEDDVQLLAETLPYSNRCLDSPSARGDELKQ